MADFILDTHILDELIAQSPEMIDKCVRATAQEVRARAVGNIQSMDAIDTGATMNSIFVKDSKSNGLGDAIGAAESRRPGVATVDGTPGDAPMMTAYIAPATNYAIWIELGSSRNHTGPRPFLGQAVETADTDFEKHVKAEFDK